MFSMDDTRRRQSSLLGREHPFERRRSSKVTSLDQFTTAEQALKKKQSKPSQSSILSLFRFSTAFERVQIVFACVCAAAHGLALPVFTIIFGEVVTSFTEQKLDMVPMFSKYFLVIGGVAAVLAFLQVRLQLVPVQRIGARIRLRYFEALLRQDAAFFDHNDAAELVARMNDIKSIQDGIGDKLTVVLQHLVMFFAGFAIAFAYSWKMTLVVVAAIPLLFIAGGIMAKLMSAYSSEGLGAYARAGSIANEALSMVRTVTAFGGHKEEVERYEEELYHAYTAEVKRSFAMGFGLGGVFLSMFSIFGFSLWYGHRLTVRENLEAGRVFIVFLSVFIGANGLGQAFPSFSALQLARSAAPKIYDVIDRTSAIDPLNLEEGHMLPNFEGHISFRLASFNYQDRVAKNSTTGNAGNILHKLTLDIPAGHSHALVGRSGSGKSTIARLLERFYDVTDGQLLIDGYDIRLLNVHWLRAQIGYVGQMPMLFMMTVRDNIALGAGTEIVQHPLSGRMCVVYREVSDEEVIAAAKLANADRFIRKLPEGYNTMLGERGAMLSGGQKQRISIARALIRNPKILILDESTSSLDAQNERIVQEALEKACVGRTTITIAHRLSTVRNADCISVLESGRIVESGSHSQLISNRDGLYRRLVEMQNVSREPEIEDDDEIISEDTPAGRSLRRASKSIHVSQAAEGLNDESKSLLDRPVIWRTMRFNRDEWVYICLGMFGAIIRGAAWPASAILFSKISARLSTPNSEAEIRFFSLMYLVCGVGMMFGNVLQMGCLGVSGERLTYKMRKTAFVAMLTSDMAFFDKRQNSIGALTTRLANEASLVRGLTGDTLGAATVAASTISTGLAIAFLGCWRIALCVLAAFPFIAAAAMIQMKMMGGFDKESDKAYAKAGTTACEAVDNMSTVNSTGTQSFFLRQYADELKAPLELGRRRAVLSSVAYGVSEILSFSIWAIAFWTGSVFVRQGHCTFEGMMMGVTGLIFGSVTLGKISAMVPDISAARMSAAKIFELLDAPVLIDPTSELGYPLETVSGKIEVRKLKFEYPSRPDVAVLHGLSLEVEPGKTFALVGKSGCGKSTLVSLLERFYDPRGGSLLLDGHELRLPNVQSLRSHLSIVSQEPDLFNRTIFENISYGLCHDDGTPVTEKMVIDAAVQSNAHDFIMELPLQYNTFVGPRGDKLSGGQKQRIAIARSLIRKPKVLLLDEATSALDAESERVCQDALDKASSERTTIMISHRLSTIRNADNIGVFSRGTIVEQGTHDELVSRKGHYADLIRDQLSP